MAHLNRKPIREQLIGIIRLTRWREYVPFVVPLTILGALLAARPNGILLDERLVAVMAANILAVAYAFMINDVEGAAEENLPLESARRNPITLGMVNIRTGYAACRIVAAATLCLYALGGLSVFFIGLSIIVLSHMYSWRPVKLKARPVTDIVTHSLMLSGLLLLAGYFIYHDQPGVVWFVAIGASLFSIYGQLYNQLRTYDETKQAGLVNTAIWLGEVATRRIMALSVVLAALCIMVAVFRDVFPLTFLISIPTGFMVASLFRTEGEGYHTRRSRGLLVINVIIAVWLIYALGDQIQILEYIGFLSE